MQNRKRGAMLLTLPRRQIKQLPCMPAWVRLRPPDGRGRRRRRSTVGRVDRQPDRTLPPRWRFASQALRRFGVPYIEAMASGTTVVATPNVGAKEVPANGQDASPIDQDSQETIDRHLLLRPSETARGARIVGGASPRQYFRGTRCAAVTRSLLPAPARATTGGTP